MGIVGRGAGPLIEELVAACRQFDIYCVIGINEREVERPGTLYNSVVLLGPEGLLWKHRKLMPTMHERLFHGFGDGTDLDVTETRVDRIGGLICWENRMPLARYELYEKGVQLWVASTRYDPDGWMATMRHIAIESKGAFVISVPAIHPVFCFSGRFPSRNSRRPRGTGPRWSRDLRTAGRAAGRGTVVRPRGGSSSLT